MYVSPKGAHPNHIMTLRGEGSRGMMLKLQLQLVEGSYNYEDPKSRYEHYVESYCQKHSECVWAKIIEQELSLSVCLKPVCLQITSV